MQSNWMDKQAGLYQTHSDNIGRPASYRDILLTEFGKNLPSILALRKLDVTATDYKIQSKPFKANLQCFTPAALMSTKANGKDPVITLTGIMQLDFDYGDIKEYDLEEIKQAVFILPFISFCGLSCSGHGFYALALIAEPEKLSEYAGHCFEILKSYDVKPDESKGKKPENLRYLSYDANMLIRENPEPLLVKHFKTKEVIKTTSTYKPQLNLNTDIDGHLLNAELKKILNVQSGERWATVQKVAYTIGGLGNSNYLYEINNAINSNSAFNGEEIKYLKCAQVCFNEGIKQPLSIK